jgi:hypothetical protein
LKSLRSQIDSLEKFHLLSETDYRNLPEELQALYFEVGMGGAALKEL